MLSTVNETNFCADMPSSVHGIAELVTASSRVPLGPPGPSRMELPEKPVKACAFLGLAL